MKENAGEFPWAKFLTKDNWIREDKSAKDGSRARSETQEYLDLTVTGVQHDFPKIKKQTKIEMRFP